MLYYILASPLLLLKPLSLSLSHTSLTPALMLSATVIYFGSLWLDLESIRFLVPKQSHNPWGKSLSLEQGAAHEEESYEAMRHLSHY